MDHHAVQPIIIQDTVIDPFRSGALVVNLLICNCTTWNCCIKADIPVRFCLYNPSIGRRRALVVTVVHFSHDERAAPHELSAGFVITVWNHAVSFAADRSAIFINGNGIGDRLRMPGFGIQVNEGAYTVLFEQPVGWIVVHGRIKAHVPGMEAGKMLLKLMESNEKVYRIMSACTGKTKQQGKIHMKLTVIAGELEQGIPEVIFVEVTVPSPGSVRVRVMLRCGSRISSIRGKGP